MSLSAGRSRNSRHSLWGPSGLLLGLLAAALAVPAAHAQSVLQSFPFRTNQLPSTVNVPDDFELFAPDSAAQVLFNPARAMQYKGRFVYATYNPRLTPVVGDNQNRFPSRFYGTALLGSDERKWLLSLGNGVAWQEDTTMQTRSTERVSPFERRVLSKQSRRLSDREEASVRFRLVRIWGAEEARSHALGVFGGYLRAARYVDESSREQRRDVDVRGDRRLVDNINRRSNTEEGVVQDQYLVGLEYSQATPHWDWVSTVAYQKSFDEIDCESQQRQVDVDSLFMAGEGSVIRSSTVFSSTLIDGATNPNQFTLSSYYRRQLGWLARTDYAFASLTGRYATGQLDYTYREEETRSSGPEDGVTRRAAEADSDLWAWGIRGAGGYAVKKRADDIRVFAGASLAAVYGRASNAAVSVQSSPPPAATETSNLSAALVLPAYLRYAVSRRFALFAGGQYVYRFDRQKTYEEQLPLMERFPPDTGTFEEQETERRTEALTLDSAIYAGLIAEHEVGLFVEVAFGSDLTRAGAWSVALGYRF